MATFKYNGVDALDLTFEKMANLSGDDLLRIIRPGAELLRKRLIEKVRAIFTQRSLNSPTLAIMRSSTILMSLSLYLRTTGKSASSPPAH